MTAVADTKPLVVARNVHKSFDHLEVLKGIDLDVMPGEVVVILGPQARENQPSCAASTIWKPSSKAQLPWTVSRWGTG